VPADYVAGAVVVEEEAGIVYIAVELVEIPRACGVVGVVQSAVRKCRLHGHVKSSVEVSDARSPKAAFVSGAVLHIKGVSAVHRRGDMRGKLPVYHIG